MKMVWDSPPLVIIIPVVVVICVIIIIGIVAFFVWKKCYKWKVIPFKISEQMLTEDDITLQGTSLSSFHISSPTLSVLHTTVSMTMNSSGVTMNDQSSYQSPQTSRSVQIFEVGSNVQKSEKVVIKNQEEQVKDTNFNINGKITEQESTTTNIAFSFSPTTTTTTPTNTVDTTDTSTTTDVNFDTTDTSTTTDLKQNNKNKLRTSINDMLYIKHFNKENVILPVKENVDIDVQGETKADEVVQNFILDRSVMGWSLPSDLDPELLDELDKSLSPEITQKTDQYFQKKINEAVKIVQKMHFPLPENASEEEKEKNRLAFHKMVWIVANDNRKPSNL